MPAISIKQDKFIPMPLLDANDRFCKSYGLSLHARWASHKGYHRFGNGIAVKKALKDRGSLIAFGKKHFGKAAALPFIVAHGTA